MTTVNMPGVWKTILLGTGLKTADDFRGAFRAVGYRFSYWASDALGNPDFVVAFEETEVDLVAITVAELGFPVGAYRRDIYKRAQELGLEICPAEVAPQLRLQYADQLKGEELFIGTEPIIDSADNSRVFSIECDKYELGHRLTRYRSGHPGIFWDGGSSWVFVRPRHTVASK